MSNRILGIGVVVAGLAASAAVATSLAGPEPASATTPEAPVSRPSDRAPLEVITTRSVVPAPARRTPAPVAASPMELDPLVAQSAAPPAVVEQPKAEAVGVEPPKYVPDTTAVTLVSSPAVNPEPEFYEVTVARHSVIGIRLDYAVSSRTAKIEDRISATVTRNVTVDGRVAVPDGARLEGTITAVDRGGKFRERPRLGLQFDTMILTDGTRMSIKTDEIVREGDSPSADAAAKVGAGTAAGAILGSVLGGKKGAVIGGVAGAGAGTATVMSGDGNETALKSGAPLTVRLTDELVVLVRKQ